MCSNTNNICPAPGCGRLVPPNEWVSYRRCENCWAESIYNPPSQERFLFRAKDRLHSGRKPSKNDGAA